MPRLRTLAVALAAMAAACGGPTEFRLDGPLSIRADGRAVEMENTTGETVYTFVVERETAALIDWMPCTSPTECDGIEAGARARVGYDAIAGYEAGEREAIVYWWHLRPAAGGGFAPDQVRAEVVRL